MEDTPPRRRLLNSLPIFAAGYPSGFATGFAVGFTIGLTLGVEPMLAFGGSAWYVYIFAIGSGFIGGHIGGRIGRREMTLLRAHLRDSERRSTELIGIKAKLEELSMATSGPIEVELKELNKDTTRSVERVQTELEGIKAELKELNETARADWVRAWMRGVDGVDESEEFSRSTSFFGMINAVEGVEMAVKKVLEDNIEEGLDDIRAELQSIRKGLESVESRLDRI